MNYTRIIKKLIGSIWPTGESHTDDDRLENLKDMCEMVGSLVAEIRSVSEYKYRQDHSMRVMGEYADSFINDLSTDEK